MEAKDSLGPPFLDDYCYYYHHYSYSSYSKRFMDPLGTHGLT